MYSFVYVENGRPAFGGVEYDSVETAKSVPHPAMWQEIKSQSEQDIVTFMNARFGDIVVLREVK